MGHGLRSRLSFPVALIALAIGVISPLPRGDVGVECPSNFSQETSMNETAHLISRNAKALAFLVDLYRLELAVWRAGR